MGRPKGYKLSEDAKRRISEANTGRQTTLGMKFSEETKKKMSIAATEAWKRKKASVNW